MDPELDAEQLELQRVVRDLVERECPPSLVRAVVEGHDTGDGFWKTLVQGDWPGLTVDPAHGGSGATAVELALVVEALGHGADPTPFLATTSQYVPVVREAFAAGGTGAAAADLLGAVCRGGSGAVAFDGDVRADRDGDGWRLQGRARTVLDGDRADSLAVVAAVDDGGGGGGTGVFAVPRDAVGATRTPAFDAALHVADVALDGVAVPTDRAATGAGVDAAVARAREEALVGVAAATVGASQRVFDLALAHIKDRKQFGVPIGSFQALKHMAVDVYIAIERARAVTRFAAMTIAEDDPRRTVAASMAKAAAGDAQRIAVQHGLQFFGGLGYTWENDVQLYVRRAKAGELLLGTSADHRVAVARATLREVAR